MTHPPYPPPQTSGHRSPPGGPGPLPHPGHRPTGPGGGRSGSPPSTGAVLGTTVWRLAVAGCAFYGYSETDGGTLYALSQLASVVAGACFALLAVAGLVAGLSGRPELPSSWLRGLLAATLLLVMITWFTVMEGDVEETWSLFEHLLTPLLVLVDWVAVGRRQCRARWWYPFTWAAALVLYLVVLIQSEREIYDFLDPDDDAFAGTIIGFLVGFLVAGFLLVGVGRLRANLAAQSRGGTPPAPRPGAPAAQAGWPPPAGPGAATPQGAYPQGAAQPPVGVPHQAPPQTPPPGPGVPQGPGPAAGQYPHPQHPHPPHANPYPPNPYPPNQQQGW